ncbi:uncharacterized protein LOC116352642 [Contarinia nasturtii]|uniref:uncharacterized protein LOC116352642 n=1 Tax=Contarinia nasturtii TaxID=265458 RepID=UPI0012D4046E|nr:uncharacterized protein LOC116352642 [Contarinia nasturtii]
MRSSIFIFFAGVCALHIQSSFAGVKERIEALAKTGTRSGVLQKDHLLSGAVDKKFSLTFNCTSLESVTLKPVPVNAQLNQLKSYIGKVADKALQSKLNSFYSSVNQFSHMMQTLKTAMGEYKKCCELYQTKQKQFLDSIQSDKDKLGQSLVKIQPFESDLLHHFINLQKVATELKVTIDSYAAEIKSVMTKIDEINSAKPKDKPKHTAQLNEIMDGIARSDVIKNLNNDVYKIVNEKCPNIISFYDGLKH